MAGRPHGYACGRFTIDSRRIEVTRMHIARRSMVTVIAVMMLAALGLQVSATVPHYALATSSSQVYMFGTDADWSIKSKQITFDGVTASKLTGIAVRDNYAFVADASADKLYVLEMKGFDTTNPTFSVVKAISLNDGTNSLREPGSVTVDAAGNVYVIDSTTQMNGDRHYSTYAYIDKNLINPAATTTAAITRINDAVLDGIAIVPTGAVVLHRSTATGYFGETYVARVNGTSATNIATPLNGSIEDPVVNFNPMGIAASGDVAYIINKLGTTSIEEKYGSLTLFNTASWSKMGNTTKWPNDLIPSAVTTFTRNSTNYLVVMGTGEWNEQGLPTPITNQQQAWLYTLDPSGNLGIATEAALDMADFSQVHKCAVSEDGEVFWFTNQQAGTVKAWSTTNWGANVGSFTPVQDALGNVVAFKYVAPVPEPTGLVALFSFSAGLIGFIKRRRLD